MSSNNVTLLITKTITTLKHFATLHPTTGRFGGEQVLAQ